VSADASGSDGAPGALAGGAGAITPGGDGGLPVMPIVFSPAVLGAAGFLLLVMRRRSRQEHNGVVAAPLAPEPGTVLPRPAAPAHRRDDGPDDLLPGEENIPRWRRPSVQAARFSQSVPRQTVYERFAAESPGLVLAPIKGLVDLPKPAPSSKTPRPLSTNPTPQNRPPRRSRNLASPESA